MSNEQNPGHTRRLDELPDSIRNAEQPEVVKLSSLLPSAWSVRLIVRDSAIPIQLKVDSRATIGRADIYTNYTPGIDLNDYGAAKYGVSRRHAELRAGKDYLVIIDRASTNGTQINGHALKPLEPYRLNHGDKLTIGTLELEVFITMMPVHDGVKRLNKNVSQLGKSDPSEKDYDRRRILIVAEDTVTANSLHSTIAELGYEVQTVSNTGDAMRQVAVELPDCLFIELDMAGDPVVEIASMIKTDLSNIHVPIFAFADKADEEKIRVAFEAGADVFLSKPLGADEVINGLDEYVGEAVIKS